MLPTDIIKRLDEIIGVGLTPDNDLITLMALIQETNAKTALEIGSYHGRSACAMLYAGVDRLICVDDFSGLHDVSGSAVYDNMLRARGHFYECTGFAMNDTGGSVTLLGLNSLKYADLLRDRLRYTLEGQTLDLAWIDGNHSYEAVQADIETSLRFLGRGGICCGHDYSIVKKAVDERFGRGVNLRGEVWYVRS
jgi:hypothetical protein